MAKSREHLPEEVSTNLAKHRFFHGCKTEDDLKSISASGFRGDFHDEEGRWIREGNLGRGVYLSCDWRTAVWFGFILLEATVQKGTKILDTSAKADPSVIAQLRREFGHEITESGDIRKILPKNKKLDLPQLVELTRYFYDKVWNRDWKSNKSWRFSAKDKKAREGLDHCVSYLKRYGFHGFGHPQDDNGIVIFAPDRIKLVRVVRKLDFREHARAVGQGDFTENLNGYTLPEFEREKI